MTFLKSDVPVRNPIDNIRPTLVAQCEYGQTTFQLTDSNKRRNDTDKVWYHAQPWLVFFVCSFFFYNAQFDIEISKIQKN